MKKSLKVIIISVSLFFNYYLSANTNSFSDKFNQSISESFVFFELQKKCSPFPKCNSDYKINLFPSIFLINPNSDFFVVSRERKLNGRCSPFPKCNADQKFASGDIFFRLGLNEWGFLENDFELRFAAQCSPFPTCNKDNKVNLHLLKEKTSTI